MKKYIDRDALAEYAHCQYGMLTASDIMKFPTVDAQPVKHGQWVLCDDGYVRCSECKSKAFIENDETIITDFCHGCGTDMRMDGDSE